MNDSHQSRISRRRPPRNKPTVNVNWRLLASIWHHLWRIADPVLWLVSLAAIVFGGFLAWTQPTGATAESLIRTAKAQQDTSADQQFNALLQEQQLALLARWSNPHASGTYRVFMGETNTIYLEYDSDAGDWRANTVKLTDNQDGTFTAETPSGTGADVQNTTWTATNAISKGKLLHYRDDISAYVDRLDLSHRTVANPTAQ